jgi:hypothetical protein
MSKKYGGAREVAENMAHALCIVDNQSYTRANTLPLLYTSHPPHKHIIFFAFTRQQLCHLRTVLRYTYIACLVIQGGSNMTGTNSDLFTHNQSRSYLNHLVYRCSLVSLNLKGRSLKM